MSATDFDLAQLIRPLEPEAFFHETWEKQPLAVSRGKPDYFRGLFTLPDVDAVIAFTRPKFLDPGDFQPGGPPAHNFVQGWLPDDQPFPVETYPDLAEVSAAFAHGKTVIIRAMQHRWPPLAALCRNLERVFGCRVHANLYLTPPGAQGFDVHYDTHEVFVIQIEGSKHWRLYGPARDLPLAEDRTTLSKDQLGPPTQEVRLEAGDLLYIPRGHAHEAFTSECTSLHITVGIQIFRWADLLGHALAEVCAQDVRFRAALPPGLLTTGQLPEGLHGQFQELLQLLARTSRLEEAVQRLASAFLATLVVLPHRHFLPPEDVEAIGLETVVEQAPGVICRVVPQGDQVGIEFPGNRMAGPARIGSALHFIARTPRFVVRSLPDDLTPSAKLVLVRRLVRERLLTVVSAPAPNHGP